MYDGIKSARGLVFVPTTNATPAVGFSAASIEIKLPVNDEYL